MLCFYLGCRNFILQLKANSKFKTNFKSSKLFIESLWKKEQRENQRKRNCTNNCLITLLRGQFLDCTAKTIRLTLNILEVL